MSLRLQVGPAEGEGPSGCASSSSEVEAEAGVKSLPQLCERTSDLCPLGSTLSETRCAPARSAGPSNSLVANSARWLSSVYLAAGKVWQLVSNTHLHIVAA